MGGDRIKDLKEILSEMAIAVEMEDFKKATELSNDLLNYDFSSLSLEEAKKVSYTLNCFLEKAKNKELEIVEILNKKQHAKRFLK
ncbi:hypothetical protein [Desulfurobacterium atlanticum]|uniref:Uncharacterized protein n=1 Tax=Desulfurobacterium atlanticum TaxID=240169 RepID=A0A238ZG50_9BACT|nr:hypothetical protein [Desulfurobacterium atlanticum]SNR81951.1 hypothetical protein SAMN06265340_10839 [Desulfurobacterium atlanticum]